MPFASPGFPTHTAPERIAYDLRAGAWAARHGVTSEALAFGALDLWLRTIQRLGTTTPAPDEALAALTTAATALFQGTPPAPRHRPAAYDTACGQAARRAGLPSDHLLEGEPADALLQVARHPAAHLPHLRRLAALCFPKVRAQDALQQLRQRRR